MINKINANDVHRITSGQVIIDLVSVAKELVENSIDAGSTKIEVTFRENGLKGLEVNDNGNGIKQEDFESLCLKYYTSKLEAFEDLEDLKTLGFRGEALSSICAIGKLSIITSLQEELPRAHELTYDFKGVLQDSKTVVNKRTEKGTKVVVEDLFHNLPVRLKNFEKNIKREFTKVVSFLNNYLLIHPGIKFLITNYNKAGQKKVMVVTKENGTLVDTMTQLYGVDQTKGLLAVDLEDSEFHLTGFISNLSLGKGRNVKDIQFFFINKRPVTNKVISKVINETYKKYNKLQFPIFVLNLKIDESRLDVNLSPDKLTINIIREDKLVERIQALLEEYFEEQNSKQLIKTYERDLTQQANQPVKVESRQSQQVLPISPPPQRITTPVVSKVPEPRKRPSPEIEQEIHSPAPSITRPSSKKVKVDDYSIEKTQKSVYNLKQQVFTKDFKFSDTVRHITENHTTNSKPDEIENLVEKEILITKEQFGLMHVIGQFNLGFIITKHGEELFIIDQHASDEKYNYEDLKKNFRVTKQNLIQPIKLELSVMERLKLRERQSIIEKHGFEVDMEQDQVLVKKMPIYKGAKFDAHDLIEIINKEDEEVNEPIKKINAILSMKACRKSIMIGQPLNPHKMSCIVRNLTTLNKPWNCPHGRPTMRHLTNLEGMGQFWDDYRL